jgi:WD40-like Beta Propeller Repeat
MMTPPPVMTPGFTATSTLVATAGKPFEAAVSSDGTVFVSVTADGSVGSATGVQLFLPTSGTLRSSCVNSLPAALLGSNTAFADLSFFPNGTDLGGGIGFSGAIFYHATDLLGCKATGFVVGQGSTSANDAGTIAVAVTPDGAFAFVANESGMAPGAGTNGNIGVVTIQRDNAGNFTSGTTLIGQIATGGDAIAGMTLSPDGSRLYVTSEVAANGTVAAGGNNPILSKSGCVQGGVSSLNGLLTVIDVSKAEVAPNAGAILATVDAGCSPVRMSETADATTLWVAVRGDDRVLAFNTAKLESDPDNALLGFASTGGTAPVGVRLFHNDQLLAVANSNRFQTGMANATILGVSSPSSANVVATIATGNFPREITLGPDGTTLYLTNFDSDTLQVIQITFH